jgi:hypothetical protein
MTSPGSPADRLWWWSADEPRPPASRPRRRWTRRGRVDAVACLALAVLWFSPACREILYGADRDFYNRVPLGAPPLAALVLNIVALAAVGFLGVQALRRVRRPAWRRVGAVAVAAGVLVTLNSARITYETVGRWADPLGGPGLVPIVSPVALVMLAGVLWMFLEVAAGPQWRRVDPAPLKRTPPSLRRVVWLVLAELDQRVTFEARPVGLELPELDRLRRESLYADGARPPAGTTEVAMPALITGRPVVAVAPLGPNDLELTFADGKSARWGTEANVFTRARTLGYDTALIGSHLPYSRVLGGSLGVADWRPSAAHDVARSDTFGESLWGPWASLAPPVNRRRLSVRRFEELGDLALRTAADERFGLVLLHLPIPQAPGIYDRAAGRLTPWNFTGAEGGYLDNLALADRMLTHLRRSLERSRLGDRTWLVVTADRWWQTSKPHDAPVDHRVPFLIRPPDGSRATHVDMAFNTLATHDLVLAILRGSVGDTADAAAWLARRPVAPPRAYTSQGRPVY